MASGAPSASRSRASRTTRAPLGGPSAIISSGEGAARPRSSHTERTALPRRAMSSEKEVSALSDCSTRSTRDEPNVGATNVPEPRRRASAPEATSAATALRAVTRLRPVRAASSRSGGSASPGASAPVAMPSAMRRPSCR